MIDVDDDRYWDDMWEDHQLMYDEYCDEQERQRHDMGFCDPDCSLCRLERESA